METKLKLIRDDNVNLILENVGSETKPPLEPEQGIPKQWLPKFFRKMVQVICLPLVLLDFYAQKVARLIVRPPFKRVGQCKRRGNCCHYVVMKKSKGLMGVLEKFWATQINGFYFRNEKPVTYQEKQVYVMGCRYLQKDGSCGNYKLRPMICRQWPVIAHFGWPNILKGCGYEAKKTKVYYKMQGKS
ncbi:MAG: YkgJ family cysteine cluster protein [Rhabdochlamydiaceae bacterium]|nr:YkgJ family cysteine cluster protein [Candidatus Amphrikana amoebophyrae]